MDSVHPWNWGLGVGGEGVVNAGPATSRCVQYHEIVPPATATKSPPRHARRKKNEYSLVLSAAHAAEHEIRGLRCLDINYNFDYPLFQRHKPFVLLGHLGVLLGNWSITSSYFVHCTVHFLSQTLMLPVPMYSHVIIECIAWKTLIIIWNLMKAQRDPQRQTKERTLLSEQ